MNKILLFVCLSASIVGAAPNFQEWESFKSQFGKSYPNQLEEELRKAIFVANKERVEQFNTIEAEKAGYKMGLNHLSDLSDDELTIRNGFRPPKSEIKNSPRGAELLDRILNNNDTIPNSIDYRKVGERVTEVKDQGQCGSCWSFSSTGALEGAMVVQAPILGLIPLSEQDLVDCSDSNSGCNGGLMINAWNDIAEDGGITDGNVYPYKARKGKCEYNSQLMVFKDTGGALLPQNEQDLKKTVAKFGPVSVAIDASQKSFALYKEGVYYEKNCENSMDKLDHAVLVIGYGTTSNGTDYWLVKNSWGTKWGDDGYIKMARNKDNNCGIATMPQIPLFDWKH